MEIDEERVLKIFSMYANLDEIKKVMYGFAKSMGKKDVNKNSFWSFTILVKDNRTQFSNYLLKTRPWVKRLYESEQTLETIRKAYKDKDIDTTTEEETNE